MTDGDALLQAIRDHPEEDTPRLAYADWLDEHGKAAKVGRADFIRTQVELARLPAEDEDTDAATYRVELEDRARDLLHDGTSWRAWAGPVHEPPNAPPEVKFAPGPFVRGFRNFAMATPERFADLGAGLFDVYPVHGLYGSMSDPDVSAVTADRFLAGAWLRRVRRFEMTFDGLLAERLFCCGHLADLEELTVRRAKFAPPGSPTPGPPALARLRSLAFYNYDEWDAGEIARVGELLPADTVTDLSLITPAGDESGVLAAVARHGRLRNVLRLRVGLWSAARGSGVAAAGVKVLTTAPFWPRLRLLAFHGDALGDAEAEALASAPPAPDLRVLVLSPHYMTPRGLAALCDSPLLRSVTHLNVGCGGGLGDEGVGLLARSPHLTRLANLELPVGRFGPKGVKAMADAPWSAGLVRLNIRDNAVRQAGVDLLADPARFPRLRRLDFQRCVSLGRLKERLTARFGAGVRFWF
jgi:uncharacterized protein (TIGR02996 family)